EDGIRDFHVTGVQTCALPIFLLRIGTPAMLRPSRRRFTPPRSTVPPSGTLTTVETVTVSTTGCWTVTVATAPPPPAVPAVPPPRSEERRVGEEWRAPRSQ